jgi:hypothetical protein
VIGKGERKSSRIFTFVSCGDFSVAYTYQLWLLKSAAENVSVRMRQSNGGQRIGSGCMSNIMCVGVLTGSIMQLGCLPQWQR